MKHVNTIWAFLILFLIVMCLGSIIGFTMNNNETAEAESYKVYVYGLNVNSNTGQVTKSVEGSILTAIYENGVYTLGEANTSSPSPRYNLDYYYKNGKYTRYYLLDENENEIPVYINSNNYYYTTTIPAYAYFYNLYYSITYNLNGGTNSSNNPNYFEANTGTISLDAPTKNGYKFLGWYKDSSLTQYVSTINKSSATANITLYAKWTQYIDLPVRYITTDHYTYSDAIVGHIYAYYNYGVYYYENLSNVSSMVSGHSNYTLYNADGNSYVATYYDNNYESYPSDGVPSYILIDADPIYSVSYELNGGSLNDGESLYNYYYSRADLATDTVKPIMSGYVFLGWYLDASFTSTMYSSSFVLSDITLYAKWAQLYQITAYYSHTDFYTASTDYVDTIEYYQNGYDYIYSSNINELNAKHEGYSFQIRTEDGSILSHYAYEDKIMTAVSDGIPSYIRYNTKEIYSITYELGDGYIDDTAPLFNYYNVRADLKDNTNVPLNDNGVFTGWYLDSEYTTTIYTSEFSPHNLTLYAKWAEKLYAPIYYYDSSLDIPDYKEVGTIYYYLDETNGYYLGYLPDTSRQIPYYFNKYDATSYKVYSTDNSELTAYSLDGKLYAIDDAEIGYIRIYKHYSINFYVNGIYVGDARGSESDAVVFPNYISGYIGENYDAAHIGSIRIGKEYALYIMKGWSYTDSSDITWFNKTEIELVNEDTTFKDITNGEYVISLYAYMTFYGKLNSVNSDIDYDEYIESTDGIITLGSLYSLDDLMQEHVTEISSDSQKTNVDKFLKYFKLDSFGSATMNLIKKLLNGDKLSFLDIWDSIFGKAIIIIATLSILILAFFNIVNFVKAASRIQSKS